MTAPCLMVQGTASNVGKSLLATALCRRFARSGLRVAPFKSQNMALNSAVTADGGEIGRAQAVQAQAAGVLPTTDMNPVLLKPKADSTAQVIIHGRPLCDLDARSYRADFLPRALEAASQSLERLRADFDLVILEGAGSPAEINLKDRDIANMQIAAQAGARVLLVGDMRQGGAFASLAGTVSLLEPWERGLVAGLILNRCPWEHRPLEASIRQLEQASGKQVLGTFPDLPVEIEAEDSLALPEEASAPAPGELRIVVPRLPRISNFTDLDPLRSQPGVTVSFVESPPSSPPSAVIIPGTKNTAEDLLWLKNRGWSKVLEEWVDEGVPLVGICGGFQMMGLELRDPHGVESQHPFLQGLGFLPVVTEFSPEKITQQVVAKVQAGQGWWGPLEGSLLEGFEIRAGRVSYRDAGCPLLQVERPPGQHGPDADGAVSRQGQIWGMHLHGLFHNPSLLRAFLDSLGRRGTASSNGFAPRREQVKSSREAAFALLADAVDNHLALDQLSQELGLDPV